MAVSRRARPTPGQIRVRRIRAAGMLVVVVAIAAALGHQLLASASSRDRAATNAVRSARGEPGELNGALRPRTRHRALGEADGAVPSGTTVFARRLLAQASLKIVTVFLQQSFERRQIVRHPLENLFFRQLLRQRDLDCAIERQRALVHFLQRLNRVVQCILRTEQRAAKSLARDFDLLGQ